MSELNEYTVSLPSGDSTVLLTDEEAQQRGLKRAERKSKTAQNKSAAPENKTRTTAQKRAEIAEKSFGGRKTRDG